MQCEEIKSNKAFIGRSNEIAKLRAIEKQQDSAIIVVHGRRRVGKTELIEQTFRTRKILKFEGLEKQPVIAQQKEFLRKLAHYTENPILLQIEPKSWAQLFELLANHTKKGRWTIFFEELQWMANYDTGLLAELKVVWDNNFRRNPNLLLVLCGSSPSFMINKVVRSRALYGRSMHEIALQPFGLNETRKFLGQDSYRVALDADLLVGGMPSYLALLKQHSSVYLGFCKHAFVPDGYFVSEIDKIFISALAQNPYYRGAIEILSKKRFATRGEILQALKLSSGGTYTDIIEELDTCGLIHRYSTLGTTENSKLNRFEISDPYLQSYYRFIKPLLRAIKTGRFKSKPTSALPLRQLALVNGLSFERWCRRHEHVIASTLGFGDVSYECGPYFSRRTELNLPGYQIDLVFKREDKTITICEVKYLDHKLDRAVGDEFNRKLALFPLPARWRVQKILITVGEASPELEDSPYFDRVLRFDEIEI